MRILFLPVITDPSETNNTCVPLQYTRTELIWHLRGDFWPLPDKQEGLRRIREEGGQHLLFWNADAGRAER